MSDEATNRDFISKFACGPSNKTCRCNCSVTHGDCEHKWDGEGVPLDEDGRGWSVTCSRCGMTAFDHDTWGGGF